jgi:leucyl-tRNA synthetase
LAKITDDIGRRRTFNTAIAAAMELLNALSKASHGSRQGSPQDGSVMQEALEIVVLGLSPIIPHVTHALWQALGHRTALIDEPWMPVDPAALQTSSIPMVVQVNGKLRGHITVAVGADEGTVRAAALADPHVQKFLGVGEVRKVIIVPGKLVNIVV